MSDMVERLLVAEMAEQASWSTEIPLWHPRGEGESDGDGDDGGGDDGGGGEGGAGEEGGGGDFDMASAFNSFRDDVTRRFDGLESRIPADDEPEDEDDEEEDEEPPPAAAPRTGIFNPRNFSDEDFDADGNLSLEAQERALGDLVKQQVAEALAPQRAREAAERRTREADALEEKYPISCHRPAVHGQHRAAAAQDRHGAGDPDARARVVPADGHHEEHRQEVHGQPEVLSGWRTSSSRGSTSSTTARATRRARRRSSWTTARTSGCSTSSTCRGPASRCS
jgi:hypothetical protein